ncbi:hypothetical protein NP493_191g02008 [Ridgeia piscesae]|uniref:Uncharacterized protein n=1 Tax=Ridgeia piscesae TaxID=27915 RepID=A0AAD9P286_RIDPI|nr:hypothetical protein NP493_191g02008 [Ridgeia piscesae]
MPDTNHCVCGRGSPVTVHSSVTVSDSCTLMSDRGLLKAGISNSMVTKAELVAEPESFVMRIVYSPRSSAVQFSIVNVMTSSSVHVTTYRSPKSSSPFRSHCMVGAGTPSI